MFSTASILRTVSALAALASLTAGAAPPWGSSNHGTILAPSAGAHIAPGASFNFAYFPHADYGMSTFAYHVWLLDGASGGLDGTVQSGLSGYYFGRFDYANYPAVPYPKNPAPAQLTMPDFSVSPGGFASGKSVSDEPMRLVVVEEWGNGDGSVGRQLSVATTNIVYNATSA